MFEGVANLKDDLPVLLVLNKKDLIKPGEIAKRIEVGLLYTNTLPSYSEPILYFFSSENHFFFLVV